MHSTQPQSSSQNSPGAPCAWASIAQGARNYGNLLIEHCLRKLLVLPPQGPSFDSFAPLDPALVDRLNKSCRLVLSPGCTTLQPGQNVAFHSFDQINLPKPCFGGCLWPAAQRGRLGMLLRALGLARPRPPRGAVDLSVARKLTEPIGARDPFTHAALQAAGIDSRLIGCPTVLSEPPIHEWRTPRGRHLVVSLSRGWLPMQVRLLRKLRRTWRISVLVHEPYEHRVIKWLSGVFFGDANDTRFSLLSHLAVPIHRPSRRLLAIIESPDTIELSLTTFDRIAELRQAFAAYAAHYGIPTTIPTPLTTSAAHQTA